MNGTRIGAPPILQSAGCLGMAFVFFFLCLVPYFFVNLMQEAMVKLHLHPQAAVLVVIGILLGGLINLPVYHIARDEDQWVDLAAVYGIAGWSPMFRRVRRDTVIAINVGGCLIPLGVAVWELLHIIPAGGWPLLALAIVVTANVLVCYYVARPVHGIGIMMPGFVSPAVAVGLAWILLGDARFQPIRAPAAFVGGVLGPLVGADLLHLRDITKVSAGMLSIGGAGTFDGIVLSGVLAAFLA